MSITNSSPEQSESRSLDVGSVWKHNNGKRYEIIGLAGSQIDGNNEDSGSMVVYKSLDNGGQLWVRPVDKFLEKDDETDTYKFNRLQDLAKPRIDDGIEEMDC